jgi:hypothetical protein
MHPGSKPQWLTRSKEPVKSTNWTFQSTGSDLVNSDVGHPFALNNHSGCAYFVLGVGTLYRQMNGQEQYLRDCERRIGEMEARLLKQRKLTQKRAKDGRDAKEEDDLLDCLARALEAMKSTRRILLLHPEHCMS